MARPDYFHIRRTRSDLGYAYWVLHGVGKHRCFIMFDTWQEAMDEAVLRLGPTPVHEFPHAHLMGVTPRASLMRHLA